MYSPLLMQAIKEGAQAMSEGGGGATVTGSNYVALMKNDSAI